MNPALFILIAIVLVGLWFLLAFIYKPLGKLFRKIYKDSINAMNEEDKEDARK